MRTHLSSLIEIDGLFLKGISAHDYLEKPSTLLWNQKHTWCYNGSEVFQHTDPLLVCKFGAMWRSVCFLETGKNYEQPEGGLMTKGFSDLIYLDAAICFLIKSYVAPFYRLPNVPWLSYNSRHFIFKFEDKHAGHLTHRNQNLDVDCLLPLYHHERRFFKWIWKVILVVHQFR